MSIQIGTTEISDEKLDAICALNKLKSLKEEIYLNDRELHTHIDLAEERLEDLLKKSDEPESLDGYIRNLYNKGFNKEYIVDKVRYDFGQGEDAENVVDTWAQYEDVQMYSLGGIAKRKKYSFTELFGVRKFLTGGKADKPSLFKIAKKVAPKAEKAGEKHTVIIIPGISEKLERITELKNKASEIEAESKMLEGEIKQLGKDQFLKMYEEGKTNPNTFILRGDKGGCAMIIPTDRYISITEERAGQIGDSYGEELIETESTFSFNNDLLQKYEEEISGLILGSKKIAEEDKPNLIQAKTVYKIKKGTIDRLYELFKGKIADVFYAIEPVFQLKNCK